MVGDCLTDIQAGEKVGCKTILLKDNMSFLDIVDIIKFKSNN
jgi:histidinol phosphatase-like enzyme